MHDPIYRRMLMPLGAGGRRMFSWQCHSNTSTSIAGKSFLGEQELIKKTFIAMCMGCAAWSGLGIAGAADSVFHDKPASPQSLPADNLPPFGMLDDHGKLVPTPPIPAGGLHRGPGSPPESTARGPSLSQAIEGARAAIEA